MDEPNGLPYKNNGNTNIIHVPTARDWLMRRMRNQKKRDAR